jgi:RimJ/RimL family protein N-acetyltransferase
MINQKISIKNCNLADAKLLLNIHNSAVKKGYFTQTKIIRIKEQIKWVNFILKDGSTKIFIGLFNKKKFGYTRFKKINKYCFEVYIGILPKYYDKGLGSLMLRKAIKKIINIHNPKKIISVVKKINLRSHVFFLKNKFRLIKFNKKKHFTLNKFYIKKLNYYEFKV